MKIRTECWNVLQKVDPNRPIHYSNTPVPQHFMLDKINDCSELDKKIKTTLKLSW